MTSIVKPPCWRRGCKHFFGPIGPLELGVFACQAFPRGIPPDILDGQDDHTEPREGDGGITFEPGSIPASGED